MQENTPRTFLKLKDERNDFGSLVFTQGPGADDTEVSMEWKLTSV